MKFIEYCHKNRILLAILPPHSSHTLQPLDVGLYSPLARAYSSELQWQQQRSRGLLDVKKSDFFRLFKAAYASTFTEKNILAAFKATGIWPMDRSAVMKRFKNPSTPPLIDREASSHLSTPDWARVQKILEDVAEDSTSKAYQRLSALIHRSSTETKLLRHEVKGLIASLAIKDERIDQSKPLPLDARKKKEKVGGGLQFWSPKKMKEARATQKQQEKEKQQEEAKKRELDELKAANKLLKIRQAEERRVERDRIKEVKMQEKAAKAAEKQREKEEKDRQKALQITQKGKRKASRAPAPKKKRQKISGGGAAPAEASAPASAPPVRTTSRGRNIHLPAKFK